MTLRVYNTLTRRKEKFRPIHRERVRMYVCGPTCYAAGHLGHARTYIAFDIIRRYLEYKGYKVKFVMNITDVHDDIIKAALKEKTDIFSLGNKYTKLFLEEQEKLGIKKADVYPRVTEHIEKIIKFIQGLENKGFAYEKDGSVYFDVSKFKDYGKLSGIKLKKAKTGTRVQTDKYEREEACDFVLWKKAKPGEPSWKSPWGKGRPGWHIECSVMVKNHLGEQIDIHGGARDLIFPHHDNEIAQTEALTGKKPFVKYWLHAGMLNINGQKMSKSLGNYIEIGDVLKKWNPRIIRIFVASSHYQSDVDWSEKNLLQAQESLERIDEFIGKLKAQKPKAKIIISVIKPVLKAKKQFEEAMDDDFNTPRALAAIFELIREINPLLDKNQIGRTQTKKIFECLKEINKVFNFLFPYEKEEIPQIVKALVKERERLRKEKKWAQADEARKKIKELGFELKDTISDVTIIKKISPTNLPKSKN